ncbi:MAG: hypothetical protein FJ147_20145 [Deltaproteobacteria bacterium]|nr:hypothetical protein [Deltaproteobacteria bacterium]
MAASTHVNNPFEKLFTNAANTPFVKLLSEVNAPLCNSWKETATQYINASEEWVEKALEWNTKATAWAKETPLAPVFEAQRNLTTQAVESSLALARRFWQIDEKHEKKAA